MKTIKKLFCVFAFCAIAAALSITSRNIYESRFLPTDVSATAVFKDMTVKEIGDKVVLCINRVNAKNVWWSWDDADVLIADKQSRVWRPAHYVITGRIGWHPSWVALLSLKDGKVIANETYGATDELDHVFTRRSLPIRLISSLKRCGVYYDGLYPGKLSSK